MKYRFMLMAVALVCIAPCLSWARQQNVALHDGVLRTHDLNSALCAELDLPTIPGGTQINLCAPEGSEFLFAVNSCLWDGCSLRVTDRQTAILRFAQDEPIDKCNAMRRLARVYFAEKAPHATALQARNWGLSLPAHVETSRPLVLLIHGLGSDRTDCKPMADLLERAGAQVACFGYPADEPIAESAALLARQLRPIRSQYPRMPIDIVAHSMGGLVAREFVEGPTYTGGVRHLVLVGTPNGGSGWGHLSMLLSLHNHALARCYNPDWHWTWMVTEGMGEAGRDLLPGSDFLRQLNSRPRRAGVQYTIVAGNKSTVDRYEASWIEDAADWVPVRARSWWGLRSWHSKLEKKADRLRQATGENDGPVAVTSTRLAGVTDQVVLAADHISLYLPMDGQPPAALPIVLDRLKR
jgi:pimeloyl-ACP methyl ester carboxylesterase